MTQYIDKATVIAEMKRRIFNLEQLGDRKFIETHFTEQFRLIKVYEGIIDFINTLEVREADLEKEIDDWYNTMGIPVTTDALKETARYFFELGLKAKQPSEEIKLVK